MFVVADLTLLAGWGLINPIFALFIVDRIEGGDVITIGIATAIYWIVKAVVQLPVAKFLDATASEKDDFIAIIMGLVLAGLSALGFIFIDQPWQLYTLQFVHAIAFALYVPSWSGVFSRHLDKNHEALDWSLDSSGLSLAAGLSGLASGIMASIYGFNTIFVMASIFSLMAAGVIFVVPQVIFPHRIHRNKMTLKNHNH